jgi:hypothetical protein
MRSFTLQTSASCDKCGRQSKTRVCPHCRFELSYDAGLIDDHSIAIIGARAAGKGHYLATLVHRLDNETGAQFGFELRALGDETRSRFEEFYRTPLLRNRERLKPTPSAEVDSSVKTPMVFRLTFAKPRTAMNISFFDSAGEDMRSLDTMSSEARYIGGAAGIIFLLDPLQIDAVRQRLPPQTLPPRDPQSEPVYIVERLRELFERQHGLGPTQKVKTPVAFALSKVDTLFPIIERGSALRSVGPHFGHLDLSDVESVNTEVQSYLDAWLGGGFSNRVASSFATGRFFGLSALGGAPDHDGRLTKVSPLRVEDPFLWLLHTLGVVPGRK